MVLIPVAFVLWLKYTNNLSFFYIMLIQGLDSNNVDFVLVVLTKDDPVHKATQVRT